MQPIRVQGVILLLCALSVASAISATIRNDIPRLDTDGNIIDAHDGCIVATNMSSGNLTYYLYGSRFGNQSGPYPGTWSQPKSVVVYTSSNMMDWTLRGPVLPRHFNGGSGWIPAVIVDETRQRFVMWYGCGQWCVCTSLDGLTFDNCTIQESRYGKSDSTDGTGLFVDDDGQGYIAFSSPNHGHHVSIERLTADYLASTKVLVAGPFPDNFVENPSIVKRPGASEYYLTYGSCCCACADGSGQVVFWAPSIAGPWKRQYPYADINCRNQKATICGDFHGEVDKLIWPAQWAHISFIPLADGTKQMLLLGHEWLSGPNHPPYAACPAMCNGGPGCIDPSYQIGQDYEVWQPIYFSADGHILPIHKAENFTIHLP
jgi:hypothetical protein